MQYLLKITVKDTHCWRLIAVDGIADLAFMGKLMALAFDYPDDKMSLIIDGKELDIGCGGEASKVEQLNTFDSLNLDVEDTFEFKHSAYDLLTHSVTIMKKEEKLFCLMPSCLIGSLKVPKESNVSPLTIEQYYNSDKIESLDLKAVTNNLRAYGSQRKDLNEAIVKAGGTPLVFKVGK